MKMLKTDSEYEKIVNLDCIGMFDTPSGTMKVLVVTIRVARSDLDQQRDEVVAKATSAQPAPALHTCAVCGQPIKPQYDVCYLCHIKDYEAESEPQDESTAQRSEA